jgi:hypothetical protein
MRRMGLWATGQHVEKSRVKEGEFQKDERDKRRQAMGQRTEIAACERPMGTETSNRRSISEKKR